VTALIAVVRPEGRPNVGPEPCRDPVQLTPSAAWIIIDHYRGASAGARESKCRGPRRGLRGTSHDPVDSLHRSHVVEPTVPLDPAVVEPFMTDCELIGDIADVGLIARGPGIRDISRLNRQYGRANWRKLKGVAFVRLQSGNLRRAALHWYEARALGKREIKRKRYLE
jgi:hypothetical protein